MRKKRIFLLGMLVPTIFINMQKVNAFEFDVSFASTGSYQETPNDDNEDGYTEEWTEGNTTYTCNYDYQIATNNTVVINGYNIFDKPILTNSLILSNEDRIVSGTSIGLSIYEKKTVNWKVTKAEVTAKRTKTTTKYTCRYKMDPAYGCTYINGQKICSDKEKCSEKIFSNQSACPRVSKCLVDDAKTTSTKTTTTQDISVTNDARKKCKNRAIEQAVTAANNNIVPSYEIELTDSNDVGGDNKIKINDNKDDNTGIITKTCSSRGTSCKFQGNGTLEDYINKMYNNNQDEDSFTTNFIYKNQRTCMNVKTAEVTYNTSKCSDGEVEIANTGSGTNEHWHYFVPLNAKSNSEDVKIKMISHNKISKEKCLYVIATNPKYKNSGQLQDTYYKNLIVKEDDSEFKGDAKCKLVENKVICENEETSIDLKYLKNNKCKLNTTIAFNVIQKFYNEVSADNNATIKFNGFNFYYRPIDINNPFPNGVTDNSLWKDWNHNKNKNPNLNESYQEVTYVATNIDASAIRTYNEKNSYTDWGNMNVDGTSNYIGDIIKRKDSDNVYKLGCGPLNSNKYLDEAKTQKNPLYNSGCGKS